MPKIKSSEIRGKSLSELKQILEFIVDDGTYRAEDIEKVRAKIEKRLKNGDTLADDEMLGEVFEGMNLDS